MASVSIRRRDTTSGPRFQIRYRLGGRTYPYVHGGTFKTMKDARARRDLIGGELAAGRNPADVLNALLEQVAVPVRSFRAWTDKFIASRIDIDANTAKNSRSALNKASVEFGDRDPSTITVDEVAAWVSKIAGKHKPGTVQLYLIAFRLLLDYVGVDPNPARDPG